MRLQLPDGNTATLSEREAELYWAMTDSEAEAFIWELIERGRGTEINDPFIDQE